MALVTASENRSLSTASASPAGTAYCFAIGTNSDPSRSISAFSRPAAEFNRLAFSELEQTNSASPE